MLKYTVKLFDTGRSVFVKVEFLISISLRLLGAVFKESRKTFFVAVFWCLLVIFVFLFSYPCLEESNLQIEECSIIL